MRLLAMLVIAAWSATLGACTYYDRIVVVGDGSRDGDATFNGNCPSGQVACGGSCVVTSQDPHHCGRCGNACSNAGGTGVCAAGVCRILCDAMHLDCDRNADNGCEVDPSTNTGNCGGCGRACVGGTGTTECRGGACVTACPSGFDDCDGVPENGCETPVSTDAMNCGACGVACANAHGTSTCANGRCVAMCSNGFGDCDGHPENGCETNTTTDGAHCGTCPHACASAEVCSAGSCGANCSTGMNCGGGTCADLSTDIGNCGTCAHRCAAAANAIPTCASGTCGFTCNPGFADCNMNAADGCETSLQFDAMHCGACPTRCSTPANASPACMSGTCSFGCNPGFANCDGNAGNGCETATRTSTASCGTCGHACAATQVCVDGNCTCPSGTSSCGTTCVALGSDSNNCGTCGHVCGSGTLCSGGSCVSTCMSPRMQCSNGCVDTSADANNCGTCGHVCGTGQFCSAGTCMCPMGQTFCTLDNSCRDLTSDPTNCGSCGFFCRGEQTCMDSLCQCADPYMPCEGVWSLSTCVNTNVDQNNCGSCGTVCATGSFCTNGSCQ